MSQPVRSLEDIWPLQTQLNRKAGVDTEAMGKTLPADPAEPIEDKTALEVGRALKNYIDAMASECHELQECLSWKHWYREAREGRQYQLQDLQNARVEAVDMFFFLVSICQLLGLRPADLFRLYEAKLGINHKRQDEDRSQAEHRDHEDENRTVV